MATRRRSPSALLASIPEADPETLAAVEALGARAPLPARVDNVRLGTAGWTDKTLIQSGRFYPKKTASAEVRLQHYAKHFSLVEVDATYYTLLPREVAEHWIEWTPDSFVFDVKAHPVLTGHPIDVTRLPADIKLALEELGHSRRVYRERIPSEIADEIEARFFVTLEPLIEAGRLGCVMLQYPPWFTATRKNAAELERLRERFGELPISVEFRHKSWLLPERRERVLDLLRAERLSYVCVDEPDVETGGVPLVATVTTPSLSLLRFHGRNVAGWSKRGASVHERFDYLYGPDELARFVDAVKALSEQSAEVHAIFNNCVRNYAVVDAQALATLLVEQAH